MKKYFLFLLTLVILFSLAGTLNVSAESAMRFNRYSVALGFNESIQLKILDITNGYTANSVKWSSENPKIATVNKIGVITGISKGKTKVKAVIGSKTLSCSVNVRPSGENITKALNNLQTEFYEGSTLDCIITNKTNIDLAFDCKITYLKDGLPVSINKMPSFVFSNNKQVVSFRKTESEYDSYKVEFIKNNMSVPKNISTNVLVTAVTGNYDYYPKQGDSSVKENINLINLSLLNNTDDYINLNAYIAYYKNNHIIYGQNFSDSNSFNIGNNIIYNPLVAWMYRTNQTPSVTTNIPDYDNYEIIYSTYQY